MNLLTKTASMLLFVSSLSQAQTSDTLDGRWIGTTKSPSTANELQIQVKISQAGGTWRYVTAASKARNTNCLNRDFPLSIKPMPNAKMIFNVDGPSVITGCPSFDLTLERTDELTLSGTFKDGRHVVLKKQ